MHVNVSEPAQPISYSPARHASVAKERAWHAMASAGHGWVLIRSKHSHTSIHSASFISLLGNFPPTHVSPLWCNVVRVSRQHGTASLSLGDYISRDRWPLAHSLQRWKGTNDADTSGYKHPPTSRQRSQEMAPLSYRRHYTPPPSHSKRSSHRIAMLQSHQLSTNLTRQDNTLQHQHHCPSPRNDSPDGRFHTRSDSPPTSRSSVIGHQARC